MGLLTSTTDPNSATTSTVYDVFGRRTSVTTPLDQGYPATAQYAYTLGSTGTPSKVEVKVRRDLGQSPTADYQYAWYFYDGMGRLIQKQTIGLANGAQARIIVVNTKYDQRGKMERVSKPYYVNVSGGYTGLYQTPSWGANTYFTYEYDPIGRTVEVTNPDGTNSTTVYDHWLTTSTDENGHKKDFLSDAFGRTTRAREYQSGAVYATTTYGYDLMSRLVDTWDNANNNTHLTYDWLGRKTQMQDPDMGTWTYGYDNAGNLLRQTDARSNSVCFDYDDLNRVTIKTARTGTDCNASLSYSVNYYYDDTTNGNKGLGRRTLMTDPNGSQSWVYDKQGRVISTSQTITGAPANPYNTAFTYDAMNRARTMTYPDGEVVTNAYNNQGLLQSMSSNDSIPASISTVSYNAASQITSLPFGNGATTNYTYDAQDQRLTDIVTTKNGTTLLNVHYTFDNVGNILSAQDNIGTADTTNYGYDDLDRLLRASVTSGANQYSRSWTYYENGNTKTRVEQGVTTSYTYDTNHKHAVAQAGRGKYFCYDANGNMTRRNATTSSCTDGDTMTYDIENRMTSMVTGSGTTTFAYNGDGVRVSRTISTGTTYYIGNYYEIWKPAGSATFSKYYYFGSTRVAARIPVSGVSTLFYMQGDHLGSSSLLMATDGTLQTRQTYFPYGAKRVADGSPLPTAMDTTFTGQKSDDSTGLMYYGARYYDSALGRFTQPDTIVPNQFDPQSLNRFSYVRNNPINLIDPTGHEDCAPEDDWCWQNRWFEAHGQCWSDTKQDWSKLCQPEFQDKDILGEVLGESGGLSIVARANPIKLLQLLAGSSWSGLASGIGDAIGNDPKKLQLQLAQIMRMIFASSNPLGSLFYGPNSVDAVGVGASWTCAFDGGSATGGLEFIYNMRSGELTLFAYMGGSLAVPNSVGASATLAVYDIYVWNLPNNASYSGPFWTLSITAAYVEGLTVSAFTGNKDNPLFFWESAYGFTAGVTGGAGASGSISYLSYCSVTTLGVGEPIPVCGQR